MKKLYFIFMVVAVLSSCKKDNSGPSNNITYNGKAYDISKGYLENKGLWNTGLYEFDLTLASENITMTENSNASGVGNATSFQMLSSSATELSAGSYTFSTAGTTANTFAGYVGLDFDIANVSGTLLNLVGGTVTIKKDGDNYDITFNGVIATGKTITGAYKGTLIYYDRRTL
jgi:hypothetical protein